MGTPFEELLIFQSKLLVAISTKFENLNIASDVPHRFNLSLYEKQILIYFTSLLFHFFSIAALLAFTCSMLTMGTLEQGVK